jgi:hypothetical protein
MAFAKQQKLAGVLAGILCGCACAHAAPVEVGFVANDDGAVYVYTTDSHVPANATIHLQYPSDSGAARCCITLKGSALGKPVRSTAPVSDALFGKPVFRYALKQAPAAFRAAPFLGTAVIGATTVVADHRAGGNRLLLGHARANHRAASCLGSEGDNLCLIRAGKLDAQLYYGFDYSVEANCEPGLFELPTR